MIDVVYYSVSGASKSFLDIPESVLHEFHGIHRYCLGLGERTISFTLHCLYPNDCNTLLPNTVLCCKCDYLAISLWAKEGKNTLWSLGYSLLYNCKITMWSSLVTFQRYPQTAFPHPSGHQRTWYPGHPAGATQRRAGPALREDQDPALHPGQGRAPVPPASGGHQAPQARNQEAPQGEEHPQQECGQCRRPQVRRPQRIMSF